MIFTYQILTNLDCNLRCKYCFEHTKNQGKNSIENARQYISDALRTTVNEKKINSMKDIVFEFVGGESFLHIDFIRECFNHIVSECLALEQQHLPMIYITTNGTLFDRQEVRDFIEDNGRYLNIGISIDGTKEIHDANRVDVHGNGTWEKAVAGFDFLKKHVPLCHLNAKATYNHATIDRYADGVIELIKLGFRNITANGIYEEQWTREDGAKIYMQLCKIADYLYDNNLVDEVKVHQINPEGSSSLQANIGIVRDKNHCGSCEYMRCLGFDGKVYGCHRFASSSMHPIGEVGKTVNITDSSFIEEVSRQYLDYPEDCRKCSVQALCGMCSALPYEEGISSKDFYAQKRQCGFTLASAWAKCYLALKLQEKAGNG